MRPGVGAQIETMATNSKLTDDRPRSIVRDIRKVKHVTAHSRSNPSDMMQRILPEDLFLGMLCLDRKRAERSGKKLALLLLDAEDAESTGRKAQILEGVIKAANVARRETDPAGWYKQNAVLGIIFTELGPVDATTAINKLSDKVREALVANLKPEDLAYAYLTVHVFADDSDDHGSSIPGNTAFYPDLLHRHQSKKLSLVVKRTMDIVGSLAVLVLFAPLFLLVAVLVKLTSKG